jgi:hypothetical protein
VVGAIKLRRYPAPAAKRQKAQHFRAEGVRAVSCHDAITMSAATRELGFGGAKSNQKARKNGAEHDDY